ncbi:uncharacterized protein [Dermacentor andersoni]|uniref:uncharacterized protein isoform X2 n=1 Tax=Dermacentor andersoni TaxID=34620 RepID=UPI003B3A12BE
MDRRSEDWLRHHQSDMPHADGCEDGGYQGPRSYRNHLCMDTASDLWSQRECHEGRQRQDCRAYENRAYEPETYACVSDKGMRDSDHYRDSDCYQDNECKEQRTQGWYGRESGYEGYRNNGRSMSHDRHGNSYDSDFYDEHKQRKLPRHSHHIQESVNSQPNMMQGEIRDHEVDFYDCYGSTRDIPRRKVSDSSDKGYNACGSQRPVRMDSEAHYKRDNSCSSTADEHWNDTRTYNDCGRLNGKYKTKEKYVKDKSDLYCWRGHHYTEMREGVCRHAELSYYEPRSYSFREQSYKDDYTEDEYSERSRKDANGYCDRHERDNAFYSQYRNQESSDSKGHLYCYNQRAENGYLVHRSSQQYMDRRKSPVETFHQHEPCRMDADLVQRQVDHDSSENEPHVYRNRAYEDDDVYVSEDISHTQTMYPEESNSDDHLHYHKRRPSDDSLSYCSSHGYIDKTHENEDIVEGHRGELQRIDMESKSAQLEQSSARKRHGNSLPKLFVTQMPAARENSAIPKRTPLTPTTFALTDDAEEGLLEIPRCTENSRRQSFGKHAGPLVNEGSQRFATMKNARRIAEEMGMEEARAEARVVEEQVEEFLEEYGGQVKRTSWARRNQLQRSPPQEGEKFDAWNLKSFKAMKKASELGRDITTWLTMWSSALKTIEGHFGTGVVSYFLFLRWLLLLNLLMFLLPALFIITPHWILPTVFEPNETAYTAVTTILTDLRVMELSSVRLSAPNLLSAAEMDDVWAAGNRTLPKMQECYDKYHTRVAGQTKGGISQLQDFLQGTGWMELTALFAGRYINSVDHIAGTKLRYNFPLAYVLTNVACFVLCLLLMVRYTTAGVREALLVSEGKLHRYCNMVFASWDFCITDERTARLKHVSIVQELKSDLAEERRRAEIASWSRRKKVGLFVVRLLVNLFVVAVIVGSLFAVYNATSFSFQRQSQAQTTHKTLALVIQFVPSLVITGLNLIVPALFSKLIRLENYSVAFQVKLTLLRTVFLRFTSIFVLLLSLYKQINCSPVRENNCLEGYGDCKKPMCWETAVGQQIYKLTMLDFIVGVTLVFVVECPRKLIVTRCECKLAKVIGQQEFNIPNRVLDLVYSQTLCWLGTFYCPLLPAITLIKYFIIFYVQKFTLMNNSAPSQTPYRASRSNTFFVIVLLLALFLAVIPFSYALVEIQPSLSCGPFQKYFFTWEVVPDLINSWKDHPWGWYVVKAVDFLTSVAFGVPVVVVLAQQTAET